LAVVIVQSECIEIQVHLILQVALDMLSLINTYYMNIILNSQSNLEKHISF
jgi:hypothetical protein